MVGNLISRAGNGPVLLLGLAGAIFGGNLLRAGDVGEGSLWPSESPCSAWGVRLGL
jgi:hypothetical protein